MKCPNCGNKIEKDDRFCQKCGCNLETARAEVKQRVNVRGGESDTPGKNGSKPFVFILIGCVLLVGVTAAVVILHMKPGRDGQPEQKKDAGQSVASSVVAAETSSEITETASGMTSEDIAAGENSLTDDELIAPVDESDSTVSAAESSLTEETTDSAESSVPENAVARMGETYYTTLDEAVWAAEKDAVITLVADVREDMYVAEDARLTLDLNGHTLTNDSTHTITNAGELTVKGEGMVDNVTPNRAALLNETSGMVSLQGGIFTRSKENGVEDHFDASSNTFYTVTNYGSMTVDGATIENSGTYSTALHNGWKADEDRDNASSALLVFISGTIKGGIFAIKNDLYGTMEIRDGEFSGSHQALVYNKAEVKISGGVFEDAPLAISNHGDGKTSYMSGTCYVSGGTFDTDRFSEVGRGTPDIIRK